MGSKVPPKIANSFFACEIINPYQFEVLNKEVKRELQRRLDRNKAEALAAAGQSLLLRSYG